MMILSALLCAGALCADRAEAADQSGGVPSMVALSIGFGDDDLYVINGAGAIGMFEFFGSDVWAVGGLYTSLAFGGDVIDDSNDQARMAIDPPNVINLPVEGWSLSPGGMLGLAIGAVPLIDIYLLGYIAPSFALLKRYQRQNGRRVKIDDRHEKIGFDYGAIIAFAYTGSQPWLRGLTLGVGGGYYENTFDRWHLGFTIGVSF